MDRRESIHRWIRLRSGASSIGVCFVAARRGGASVPGSQGLWIRASRSQSQVSIARSVSGRIGSRSQDRCPVARSDPAARSVLTKRVHRQSADTILGRQSARIGDSASCETLPRLMSQSSNGLGCSSRQSFASGPSSGIGSACADRKVRGSFSGPGRRVRSQDRVAVPWRGTFR